MSSGPVDSIELCRELQSALKEIRAGHGELETTLDGMFNELPTTIEGFAARLREAEQALAADYEEETDRFRQQIAELVDQQAAIVRQQAAQAADAQAVREQNAALAERLADQERQTQHWYEAAQQKAAEIEGIAARQREVEQATAAEHEQEAARLRQQIAAFADQKALVEREHAVQAADALAACQQNAALAAELVDQKRQTQHWQKISQEKAAEIEGVAARLQEGGKALAADYERQADQLRRQIAEVTDQKVQIERQQTAIATELRAAREQIAAMAAEHEQATGQLRKQVAELVDQMALVERQKAAQAADALVAREQIASLADQLADQKRQTQHWHELAHEKATESEGVVARLQEAEKAMTANYEQETDRLRKQIAELVDQKAQIERQHSAQATELQATREQIASLAEQFAEQNRLTQQWQETAGAKTAEIEGLAARLQQAEQVAAAGDGRESDQLRKEIAELADRHALIERQEAAQASELQIAREKNAALAEQLAEQKRQTERWREMADCTKQIADLRNLIERQQASQAAQTRAASEEAAARAPHFADLGRQLDRLEDSLRPQAAPSDSAREAATDRDTSQSSANGESDARSAEQSSERDRLMAQHMAQWEELLRTRSRTHK